MKTRFLLASLLLVLFLPLQAQRPASGKMSPMVRKMVRQHERQLRWMPAAAPAQNETDDFHTCVFIRITENASEVMALHQCRQLAQYGDIYIVDVPLSQVSVLSSLYEVKRIEAEAICRIRPFIAVFAYRPWFNMACYQQSVIRQASDATGIVIRRKNRFSEK